MNVSVYYCMYSYLFLLPYFCHYLFEPFINDGQIKQLQGFILHMLFFIIGDVLKSRQNFVIGEYY